MQNFKPVELEDVYRLFNLGATSLVSAADGDDVDVMPATWVCPLNTTPALSTAVIDSVHYTRKLIDKTSYFMLSLPSLEIARETLYSMKPTRLKKAAPSFSSSKVATFPPSKVCCVRCFSR